jgi:hypothetical protein
MNLGIYLKFLLVFGFGLFSIPWCLLLLIGRPDYWVAWAGLLGSLSLVTFFMMYRWISQFQAEALRLSNEVIELKSLIAQFQQSVHDSDDLAQRQINDKIKVLDQVFEQAKLLFRLQKSGGLTQLTMARESGKLALLAGTAASELRNQPLSSGTSDFLNGISGQVARLQDSSMAFSTLLSLPAPAMGASIMRPLKAGSLRKAIAEAERRYVRVA